MNEWNHVMPVNDLIEHTFGKDCECRPTVNASDLLIVHNAIDNREFDEIAKEIEV